MENTIPRCKTCKYFKKGYLPKLGWLDRCAEAKKDYPNLSDKAAAALANAHELWEQEEAETGFCRYHDLDRIPNHMSCLNHESI